MNKKEQPFKPLWRIHNRTYRQYARGTHMIRLKKYADRIMRILKFRK